MEKVLWLRIRKDIMEDWRKHRGLILSIGVVWCFFLIIGKGICPLTNIFGLPCPGCGLTRSAFLLFTGQVGQSWNMHPFTIVWIVFLLLIGIERYVFRKNGNWKQTVLIIIVAGMFIFYLYRMKTYFPNQEPMIYLEKNRMAKVLPGYRQWIQQLIDV